MVLSDLDQHRWSLGLERVHGALEAIGHPERSYSHVLVAGTNGKGSTCVFLERMLIDSGYRVGTTISPHVSRFSERFRINGIEAKDADLTRLRHEIEPRVKGIDLTYFEWCVVLAARLFQDSGVDAGIFEVGLGGRYDASNALEPAVSLITDISIDHTDYLGTTIAQIAQEKAMIARSGKPLATTATGAALDVIREHAHRIGADLHEVNTGLDLQAPPGLQYQALNAALALKAAHLLGAHPDRDCLDHAVRTSHLPGRIEELGGRIIMDVAHNPSSMLVLVKYLKDRGFDGAAVVGILSDKDYLRIVQTLKEVCPQLYIAPVQSPRSWGDPEMKRVEALGGVTVCAGISQAFNEALQTGMPIVVTGSFYTVGEVRESLICRGWSSWLP